MCTLSEISTILSPPPFRTPFSSLAPITPLFRQTFSLSLFCGWVNYNLHLYKILYARHTFVANYVKRSLKCCATAFPSFPTGIQISCFHQFVCQLSEKANSLFVIYFRCLKSQLVYICASSSSLALFRWRRVHASESMLLKKKWKNYCRMELNWTCLKRNAEMA